MKLLKGWRMRNRVMLSLLAIGTLQAADLELQPDTLKSWDEYVRNATAQMQQRVQSGKPFLCMDDNHDRAAKVRTGEIVVWPARDSSPKRVPSGLIHDWMGAAFIPDGNIEDVLSVVRDYARYKEVYKPAILDAKLIKQNGGDDQYSMLLRSGSFFSKTALNGEFKSSYIKIDEKRGLSVSCTSRVQEIDNFGQPGERKLPPDQGHGYVWRMCSLSQLEERDGGVYVTEQMIALSRDIPAAVRWMAGPVIRRVAKETLSASIGRTRIAVGAKSTSPAVVATRKEAGFDPSGACARGVAGCLR